MSNVVSDAMFDERVTLNLYRVVIKRMDREGIEIEEVLAEDADEAGYKACTSQGAGSWYTHSVEEL